MPARRALATYALVSLLLTALVAPRAGHSQPPAPAGAARAFFHGLIGDWIGTYQQTTDGVDADDKYFHATVKQAGADGYEIVFDYYRLDQQTGAPITVGKSTMSTTISPDGTATNHVTGKGQVRIDENTTKPEQHDLTEVLRVCPSGEIQGTGSGTIRVSGMPLGAGRNGKVRNYRSTWTRSGDVLTVSQQMGLKFKVLCFAKGFNIAAGFTAKPGSDVIGLMRSACKSVTARK